MLQPFVETCVGDFTVFVASRWDHTWTLQISDLKGKLHLQQHNTLAKPTKSHASLLHEIYIDLHTFTMYTWKVTVILLMLIACTGAIAASQLTIQLRSLPNCGGNQRAWKSMSTRCPPDSLYRLDTWKNYNRVRIHRISKFSIPVFNYLKKYT